MSYTGELDQAVRLADRCVELLGGSGPHRAEALLQRAKVLRRVGRTHDALADLTAGVLALDQADDPTMEGDLRGNRGVLLGFRGQLAEAITETERAREVFQAAGWTKRVADMSHNLAWLAGRRGDLVESLRLFDETEVAYVEIGMSGAAIFPDRCEVLIAAGLEAEAQELARRSVAGLRRRADLIDLAEALVLLGRASLAAGDAAGAQTAAAEAEQILRSAGRVGWTATAASLGIEARLGSEARLGKGQADDADIDALVDLASEADGAGLGDDADRTRIVAAHLAVERGDHDRAHDLAAGLDDDQLGFVAQAELALVRARLALGEGRREDALDVASSAIDRVDELRAGLGGTELRAHLARRTDALARFGLDVAAVGGDPGEVLAWAERIRANALAAPPVRPPADEAYAHDLDLLRSAVTELDVARRSGRAPPALVRRVAGLGERVRRHARRAVGGPVAERPPTIDEMRGRLGDRSWVQLLRNGTDLLAIVVDPRRAAVVHLGPADEVEVESDYLRSALQRSLACDPAPASTRDQVARAAERLERRVVTPLHLGDGPVVLSPSSGLQATPWGVVPALAGRSLVVVPSATSWCRAETRRVGDVGAARPDRGVVLVAGPDLHCAVAEVEAVGAHRRDADHLTGATATVANVAKAMAGAGLVHLACHGTFARNNPMFSSLLLHDGPLFVYDLERLVAAPEIVVLPSCHGGLAVRRPAGQMLGTLASLLAIGTRTVVAAALPVPDRTDTVAAMALLHERLAAGDGPARALAAVRRTTPLLGGAFNCAGTG